MPTSPRTTQHPNTPPPSIGSPLSTVSRMLPSRPIPKRSGRSAEKEACHKEPDLVDLSAPEIDQVKRRPPTYQAKDADLRRMLNSGDYVPTEIRCDVCSSRDWPCVERRPSGKNRRAIATSCAGCQISHKKCKINGQRRADVLALRHAEQVAEATASQSTSTSTELRVSPVSERLQLRRPDPRPDHLSRMYSPAVSQGSSRPPPLTLRISPPTISPPDRYPGLHEAITDDDSDLRSHATPLHDHYTDTPHPSHQRSPTYYSPRTVPTTSRPVRQHTFHFSQELHPGSPFPMETRFRVPYVRSPTRSPAVYGYDYRRRETTQSPSTFSRPPRFNFSLSPQPPHHEWKHTRPMEEPRRRLPLPSPSYHRTDESSLPSYSRMLPAPISFVPAPLSSAHINPVRALPRPRALRRRDGETIISPVTALPSPGTILSWSDPDGDERSEPSRYPAPTASMASGSQAATSCWPTSPVESRPSEPVPLGLTTPPRSVTSGSSNSALIRKRTLSVSSMDSTFTGEHKRSRSSWWHTIEDGQIPEARYHIPDVVFNALPSPIALMEPRARALRPADAERAPFLEHVTELDETIVGLLGDVFHVSDNKIHIPAYLYRPRRSCLSCSRRRRPCIISADDIELPRYNPPGTMIVPLPPCLGCSAEHESCRYHLVGEPGDLAVSLKVAIFETRPRLKFPLPLSTDNLEQWAISFSPADAVPELSVNYAEPVATA